MLRKIQNKKAEESMTFDYIVIAIIVLLVVLVLVLFIFRSNIKEWLRNLPGFQPNNEDVEINNSEIRPGTSYVCKTEVATIQINHIVYNGKDTGLYFAKEGVLGPLTEGWGSSYFNDWIYLKYDKRWRNPVVALLNGNSQGTVKIINVQESTGNKEIDDLLDKLDGAYIYAAGPYANKICQNK